MRVRLYVDHPLGKGQSVPLSTGQAHYVASVLRLGPGAEVSLFNGRDGEWSAALSQVNRKAALAEVTAQTASHRPPPDLWLMFAPLKKARTDFVVEKAVEMGAARIMPVRTRFTNAERVRIDRLQAHAVEAAEQCGATSVPRVEEMQTLDRVLDAWTAQRRLMFCNEGLAGGAAALAVAPGPWAILIGPEGGFSDDERARLETLPGACPVSLGPRILRAETAAVAAMALWQSTMGDWV